MHKCTGVQAAALASEGSVEFAKWPKTTSKKEVADIVKNFWDKRDKKGLKAASNALNCKGENITEQSPTGHSDSCASGVSSSDSKDCSSSTSSSRNIDDIATNNCTATGTEEASSNSAADTKTVSCSPVNNDVSGGITTDHLEEIDTKWGPMVAALDPLRDVLLFPSDAAESASTFPWGHGQGQGQGLGTLLGNGKQEHRWRLVVLEASWQHGKTMHRQVT